MKILNLKNKLLFMENLFTKALRNKEQSLVKVIEKKNKIITNQRLEKERLRKSHDEWLISLKQNKL